MNRDRVWVQGSYVHETAPALGMVILWWDEARGVSVGLGV